MDDKIQNAREKYLARMEIIKIYKEMIDEDEINALSVFLNDCDLCETSHVLNTIKKRFLNDWRKN